MGARPARVALAVAIWVLAPSGARASEYSSVPEVLRIGYTSFDSPLEVVRSIDEGQGSSMVSVGRYLRYLSAESRRHPSFRRPTEFDLVLGNYYQVLAWLRSGELDGAVVSPFTAFLLQRAEIAEPVVELEEWGAPEGQWPLVAAVGPDGPLAEGENRGAFHEFLGEVKARSGANPETCSREVRRSYQVHLVAHLSSSGFLAPVLEADRWFRPEAPALTPGEREAFWDCFFGTIGLALSHSHAPFELARQAPGDGGPTSLYFSYDGRCEEKMARTSSSLGGGPETPATWDRYDFRHSGRTDPLDLPPIPNDVLVMRGEVLARVVNLDVHWRATWQRVPSIERPCGYRAARPYDPSGDEPFRRALEQLFRLHGEAASARGSLDLDSMDPLARRFYQWFEEGRYGFTIPELFRLVINDQISSERRHLSLVLPGGGVKSAYQARILDLLYCPRAGGSGADGGSRRCGPPLLTNEPVRPADTAPELPIPVSDIVGTSGGAMMGLFAAQKTPPVETGSTGAPALGDPAHPDYLTSLWIENERATTRADLLFPWIDMLRWVSVYAILLIFMLLFYLLRYGFRGAREAQAEDLPGQAPAASGSLGLLFAMVALLALIPPLVTRLRTDPADRLTEEGLIFFLMAGVAHFAISCTVWSPRPRRRGRFRDRLGAGSLAWAIPVVAGLGMLTIALLGAAANAPRGLSGTTLATLGGLALALGAAFLAADPGLPLAYRERRDFLLAIATLAAFILLSFVLLGASVLLGRATFLELTPGYWLQLALCASISAALVFAAAWLSRGALRAALASAFDFLGSIQHLGPFRSERALGLLTLFGFALLWWNFTVAPAIYDGIEAQEFFEQRVRERSRWDAATGEIDFRTHLIVTASSVYPTALGDRLLPPGELYFCYPRSGAACPEVRNLRWLESRPDFEGIRSPVFASGSPFPVFPPHEVEVALDRASQDDAGRRGERLIDGGYAHNVPLEAASLAGARQVLLVRSEPDPEVAERLIERKLEEERTFPSQLFRFVQGLPGFLFTRAQELDRSAARGLFVASLVPTPPARGEAAWPWLADFRASVVRQMRDRADRDFDRERIGRVESWGQPVTFQKVRAGGGGENREDGLPGRIVNVFDNARITHLELAAGPWNPDTRSRLMKCVTSEGAGKAAVFDFDNTLIWGDVGEAVFLRMILEGSFRAELEEFWDLFPDPGVRARLRELWRTHGEAWRSRPHRLDEAEAWEDPFREWVALLWGQYEAMLDDPARGAAVAYPWVVQLMVGMEPEAVRELARRVWADETGRLPQTTPLATPDGRTVELPRGLQPYPAMEELLRQLADMRHRGDPSWQLWVVTASAGDVVAAVVEELASGPPGSEPVLEPARVLGMRLELGPDGRFSDRMLPPVTYRRGKVEALRRQGIEPRLVVGDSVTDLEMLLTVAGAEACERLALVIHRGASSERLLVGLQPHAGIQVLVQPADGLREPIRRTLAAESAAG